MCNLSPKQIVSEEEEEKKDKRCLCIGFSKLHTGNPDFYCPTCDKYICEGCVGFPDGYPTRHCSGLSGKYLFHDVIPNK